MLAWELTVSDFIGCCMTDLPEWLISIGSIIIDDIILPDGQSRMAILGGGATHAVMGMRVWWDRVGLVSAVGEDFPAHLWDELAAHFDLGGVLVRPCKTPRAWQLFETDGTRNEVFRTSFGEMAAKIPTPEEFPETYRSLKGVHLHCSPDQVEEWVAFLRSFANPFILWEPWDTFCIPENWQRFCKLAGLVDCVSPNWGEGRQLSGLDDPGKIAERVLESGVHMVALRMGEQGSLLATREGLRVHLPPAKPQNKVDVTGAGNAYCGGLIAGIAQHNDPFKAGCMAAVSASFALEQFGALYSLDGLRERAKSRLEDYCLSFPDPRRKIFDRMAANWDALPIPPGMREKLERIAASGHVRIGDRVLDVGCGTGHLTQVLLEHHPARVIALDFSWQMLKRMCSKISHAALSPVQVDALALPLAAESVQAIFCHGVFPHFSDFDLALDVFWRVLTPDCRLVISHAIGREQVNAIHASHVEAILRTDQLPPATKLAERMEAHGWRVVEQVDERDFYLVVAEKR